MIDYELNSIIPGVYHVRCGTRFDLGMLFLRSQEFYESQNEDFKGKSFTILDFMRWYSKDFSRSSSFTYPSDWSGYNVPGLVSIKATGIAFEIGDANIYDRTMRSINSKALNECGTNFYLVGTTGNFGDVSDPDSILAHEMAHALYYLDAEYKSSADKLVDKYRHTEALFESIRENGYHDDVADDEFQAYMVSGASFLVDEVDADALSEFRNLYTKTLKKHLC